MITPFIKVKYNYLEDSSLNDTDRVIYGFIVGMIENKKTTGKFFMTNKEMSRVLHRPISTISKHLKRLEDKEYIVRQTSPISYGGKFRLIVPLKYVGKPNRSVLKDESHSPKVDIPIIDKSSYKNNIDESSYKEPSLELIQEMENLYADKDIPLATSKFKNYYQGKSLSQEELDAKYRKWCDDEHPDNKKIIEKFKADSTGNFYMAYCGGCTKSDFYEKKDLKGDSRCCKNKLHPKKPNKISPDTLSKNGYSDNYTRSKKSQSVEDILSDYKEESVH